MEKLSTLAVLLVCSGAAWSTRDTKAMRSMPAISSSLVNLGKMDISIHFNSAPKGFDGVADAGPREHTYTHSASPFFVQKPELQVELEPCPCSSIKNFKNPFLSNPSELINRVLRSNDLFSANQEASVSTMCCDSHEHVEDTVLFEFSPKNNVAHVESAAPVQSYQPISQSSYPSLSSFPAILDSILPKSSLGMPSTKSKAIEIFFFPKTKDGKIDFSKMPFLNTKKSKKSEIQFVGDKELLNDFKTLKYRPSIPVLLKKEDKEIFRSEKQKSEKRQEKERLEIKEKKEIEEMRNEEAKLSTTKEPVVETSTPDTTMSTPNAL